MSEDGVRDVSEVFKAVSGKVVSLKELRDSYNGLVQEKLSPVERVYLNCFEKVLSAGLSLVQCIQYPVMRIDEPYYEMIGDGSNGLYVHKDEADTSKTDNCFVHVARDMRMASQLEKILPFKLQRKITQLIAEAYDACNDYNSWKDQGRFVPFRTDPDMEAFKAREGATPE